MRKLVHETMQICLEWLSRFIHKIQLLEADAAATAVAAAEMYKLCVMYMGVCQYHRTTGRTTATTS